MTDEPYLILAARNLNDTGQCCGRKPLVYKRPFHQFCTRCCASFDVDGKQITNWAWQQSGDIFRSTYPDNDGHDYVRWAKVKCQ